MTDTYLTPSTTLAKSLRGRVLWPADPAYDAARQGWNQAVRQHPALIVQAGDRHDVRTAVQYARSEGLGVGVMATGHGIITPCDGGLLIDTSRLQDVRIEPDTHRIHVAAGTRWQAVMEALAPHGLAGLAGSSPHTGVVGYSLGGGFGWLGRRFGLASHHILSAEIVTADGHARHVSRESEPELLWALAGGTGNFGVVTALEFAAHPVPHVLAGNLYYPLNRMTDVGSFFARWAPSLPPSITAALTFRFFPPTAPVPAALRGQRKVAIRAVACADLTAARALIDEAVGELGAPAVNTYRVMSPSELGTVSADPVDPLAALSHAELLDDLDGELIDDLLPVVGPDADSPLVMMEFRLLGGALRGRPDQLSPMAHTTARYSLNAIGLAGTPAATDMLEAAFGTLSAAVRRRATGDSYVNFLDCRMGQPARVRAAYSTADWTRLVALKQKLDPDGLFRFNRNIPTH